MDRVAKLALPVAAASVGGLSGFLTAGSQFNPDVVSAVVAALLAGLIGWIVLAIRKETIEQSLVPSLFLVVFCVSFWLVVWVQVELRQKRDAEALAAQPQIQSILLGEHFASCSEIEYRTNLARKAAGLDPLRNGIVCEASLSRLSPQAVKPGRP